LPLPAGSPLLISEQLRDLLHSTVEEVQDCCLLRDKVSPNHLLACVWASSSKGVLQPRGERDQLRSYFATLSDACSPRPTQRLQKTGRCLLDRWM